MKLPDEMTETEAIHLVREIFDRFGFVGTYFTREDVESRINRPLTDEEFDRVVETRAWCKGIEESMIEHGWDLIDYAVDEAGVAVNEEVE